MLFLVPLFLAFLQGSPCSLPPIAVPDCPPCNGELNESAAQTCKVLYMQQASAARNAYCQAYRAANVNYDAAVETCESNYDACVAINGTGDLSCNGNYSACLGNAVSALNAELTAALNNYNAAIASLNDAYCQCLAAACSSAGVAALASPQTSSPCNLPEIMVPDCPPCYGTLNQAAAQTCNVLYRQLVSAARNEYCQAWEAAGADRISAYEACDQAFLECVPSPGVSCFDLRDACYASADTNFGQAVMTAASVYMNKVFAANHAYCECMANACEQTLALTQESPCSLPPISLPDCQPCQGDLDVSAAQTCAVLYHQLVSSARITYCNAWRAITDNKTAALAACEDALVDCTDSVEVCLDNFVDCMDDANDAFDLQLRILNQSYRNAVESANDAYCQCLAEACNQ